MRSWVVSVLVAAIVVVGLVVGFVYWSNVRHGTETCWSTVWEVHCED